MSAELPGLHPESVQDWILAHVPDLGCPLSFRTVGRGRSNLTFLVEDAGGRRAVLRRPPLGALLESAHNLRREHHILDRLAMAGLPVPRPLAFCDDSTVTGAQFFVMEFIEGVVADSREAVDAGLPMAARARVATALGEALAGLHSVDPYATGLYEPGKGAGYAARQLRRWTRQWDLSQTRDIPDLDRLTERLGATLPVQQAEALVHGDFTVFNTVLSSDGEVRAVLDWELSTVGDPVADLAWCMMFWPDDQRSAPAGAECVSLLPGFSGHVALSDAYRAASGRDLAQLGWWKVLSYWKLAIILEGIIRRWFDDPANGGPDPGALRPGVDRLVALAHEAAGRLRPSP